ncbi:polysaccharide biosynthesis/export family protein [Spirosoma utsteinense]|uniref:Polysaccharide export outer membrane protein n=1 Tax=Spirosoma utsteinense TaxID=2585773 RepID=A0ABR6WEN7_9BACT|nr:polysaccharide biosynthesis/export family protein [Spirosoma utsteinense]MBC3789118.1 polysaccharide export outer membrane protein [Spirosoma utsteinense]MBC3795016.1 polysaccharide export outer membrane protein [Spirosoma utsteinense]
MNVFFMIVRNRCAGYWFLGLCVWMSGCINSKELVLYQKSEGGRDTIALPARYIPAIRVGDVLSVQVSSLSPEATTFFNPYAAMTAMTGTAGMQNNPTTPIPYTPGYVVSEEGQIELPLVGRQAVVGLTNSQAAVQIRQKLLDFLKEPTVNVRNLNFQISISGEVARPALFSIPNEHISLPAALGLAGDITIYGRRDNVLIIREENGQRMFHHVDLTQRDIFKSPYFYLHPNDIVYVEPGKARVANADRTYQLLPILLSALSVISIIVTRL